MRGPPAPVALAERRGQDRHPLLETRRVGFGRLRRDRHHLEVRDPRKAAGSRRSRPASGRAEHGLKPRFQHCARGSACVPVSPHGREASHCARGSRRGSPRPSPSAPRREKLALLHPVTLLDMERRELARRLCADIDVVARPRRAYLLPSWALRVAVQSISLGGLGTTRPPLLEATYRREGPAQSTDRNRAPEHVRGHGTGRFAMRTLLRAAWHAGNRGISQFEPLTLL